MAEGYARGGIATIAEGGTGASNNIDAQKNFGFYFNQIDGGRSTTFPTMSNGTVIIAFRGSNYFLGTVDIWSQSPTTIASGGTNPLTITQSNGNVTITNNLSIAVMVFAISPTASRIL